MAERKYGCGRDFAFVLKGWLQVQLIVSCEDGNLCPNWVDIMYTCWSVLNSYFSAHHKRKHRFYSLSTLSIFPELGLIRKQILTKFELHARGKKKNFFLQEIFGF